MENVVYLIVGYGITWGILLMMIFRISGAIRMIWTHVIFQIAYTAYCFDVFTDENPDIALANYMLLLFFLGIHAVFILIHFFYLRRKHEEDQNEN